MHVGFWWGNLKVKCQLEDLGRDRRVTLKVVLKETDWEEVDRSVLLRTRTDNRLI